MVIAHEIKIQSFTAEYNNVPIMARTIRTS